MKKFLAALALAGLSTLGLAGTASAATTNVNGLAYPTTISSYGNPVPASCVPAASRTAFDGYTGLTGVNGGVAYWEGNNPTVPNGPFGTVNEIAWVVPTATCSIAYTIHYKVLTSVNDLLTALAQGFPA